MKLKRLIIMSNKMLVQIGAGKIGRGYIADLFNEA